MQDRITGRAPVGIQLEDGAHVIGASGRRGAVKRAIAALGERRVRVYTIARSPRELEQHKIAAAVGVKLENRAVVVGSPKESRAIEHTVPALQKRCVRVGAIPAAGTEMVQDS